MKILYVIIIFIILVFNSGCEQEREESTIAEKNVPDTCTISTECETPMEFIIQSNCPFTSLCVENKCQVACPMFFNSVQAEQNKDKSPMCKTDDECDCSWRGNKTKNCVCIEEHCYSIEG